MHGVSKPIFKGEVEQKDSEGTVYGGAGEIGPVEEQGQYGCASLWGSPPTKLGFSVVTLVQC